MKALNILNLAMMAPHANDWLMGKVFPWPAKPPVNKIDTHHHWVPTQYAEAVAHAGGDPSGWPTPGWSLSSTELLMEHVGTKTAILSITAPGPCIVKNNSASWKLARDLNVQAASIRDSNPAKFGFFLTLADISDTENALAEIRHGLDVLRADGVTLFTRYGVGSNYLGHKAFRPIWEELNKRKAVIFVHPTHPQDTEKINANLPQPMVDYPHETTRSAMDMLSQGIPRKYPDCKVILSHAGGTLPFIIGRVAMPLSITNNVIGHLTTGLTYDSIMKGFRWFYYDIALSATPNVLHNLLDQVPESHILYGSDFPYAPPPAYPSFLGSLEGFDLSKEQRDDINFNNAMALFPRLAGNIEQ